MRDVVPLQLQTLYQSLLDAHLSAGRVDPELGAPFLRTIRGRPYWIVRYRVGDHVRTRHIGPDTDDVRARVAAIRQQNDDHRAFERRCATMVGQLRVGRIPTLDATSGALLGALAGAGVFDLGGTLVGTHAFRLFDLEVGRYVTSSVLAQTEDLDIASYDRLSVVLANQFGERADPPITGILEGFGLAPTVTLDPKGRSGRWRDPTGAAAVDFLSPALTSDTSPVKLAALGVWAVRLRFLNYLIADPIPAVGLYRAGILVRIPRPERYAIHKLIVSQERSTNAEAKARKDLAQARALILALAQDRPYELEAAYEAAVENGPRWRELIERALALMPDVKALLP